MPLDLRHVASFVAVAETRSFSVAAKRNGTVQSAVSAHIRLLEQRLDRRLVDRGRGKSVGLTSAGTAFLVQARRLLALANEMAQVPSDQDLDQPIRLGTTVTFALSLVPRALSAFARDAPLVPVTVKTARSHELLELLDYGSIDMALVLDQGPHSARVVTRQASLVWAAIEEFAPDAARPLPLAFMEDARDLRRHAFAVLDRKPAIPATLRTHPDPIGLRCVLTAGLAVTVLPAVAIAAPLVDVGARLGLPKLSALPVSIYLASAHARPPEKILAACLAAELAHQD